MREIEFRAKSKNKNFGWVYGTPVFDESKQEYELRPETHTAFHIEQKTLGQYTGLKDKNGKKIFEGDIVKLTETNYNYEWSAVVEFGNPNSEYVWGWNLKPIANVEYNLDILCWVEMPIGATCEIIGNIYDNPELVGE